MGTVKLTESESEQLNMKKTRTMFQTTLGVPMGANQRDDSNNDRNPDRERSSDNDNNNRDIDWNPNTSDNGERFPPETTKHAWARWRRSGAK